jgi:hypothetical protein
MDSSILDLTQKVEEDTKIKSLEPFPFLPITGTQYNTPSIIRIDIENQDEFFYPHDSWLQIEGQILQNNDAPYADQDVAITNNGLMYLFSNIKYLLTGNDIESLNHCGQATTMLGMGKYSRNFSQGPGLAQGWLPDTTILANADNHGFTKRKEYVLSSNPRGHFSIPIYLAHFSGFAEDFDKIVYGMRHSLQLTRKATDADAIFRANAGAHAAAAGKIVLSKIVWWMPRVLPSDVETYRLYKQIENKIEVSCAFRMRQCASINISNISNYTWNLGVRTSPEKPRYIIVGLQSGKANDQTQNAALFDHCQVENMKVRLNSTEYPSTDINANFGLNNYAGFYVNMLNFIRQYNGVEQIVSSTSVDAKEFKDLFPLFFFDVSKQSERLNQGVVDVSVLINFAANTPQNTYAYALVISDRYIKFQSDGRKMKVIF